MQFKNIYSPTKGLITTIPTVDLPDEASPYMSGVYLKDGEVVSDYGHTTFPIPGVLKTNKLHGIAMKVDNYNQVNGVAHLITHTTTNAYEYNSTTTTWDCITKGQTIDDCESAWTASANVTSTNDTGTKLRGSKSTKLVVASAFTTGLLAYRNISSLDLHLETAAHLWIYSSIALLSGDLQLLLDDSNGCVSPLETINLPAVSANTWTPICINYATPAGDTAIISVGLKATRDFGACSIFVDDIRSVDRFTGTADNLFSTCVIFDVLVSTNGINRVKKYLGVPANGQANLITTLNVGEITTSEIVLSAKDHLILFNNTENGADCPQRGSWTNIGQLEDFINGTAGYQDLTDDEHWVICAEMLSESTWAIYKEESIVLMNWSAGQTPFRFDTDIKGTSIAGKLSVFNDSGIHYVLGRDNLYTYTGDKQVKPIDQNIKRPFFTLIDQSYIHRSFILSNKVDDEMQFWVPTASQYPDAVYCYDTKLFLWYKRSRTMTAFGSWIGGSAVTIGNLVGTIGEQNYTYGSTVIKGNTPIFIVGDFNGEMFNIDRATLNNNGVAISNEFQTPDFIFPTNANANTSTATGLADLLSSSTTKDGQFRYFRVPLFYFEAKGQSITTEYSTDSGSTWSPTQGQMSNTVALAGTYDIYQQDMDVVCRKIRFRFRNVTLSSGFFLRHYGFGWIPRSTRR